MDKPLSYSEKQKLIDEAIQNHGFYGKNGVWNSIITFPGDKRLYRERVETIVIRNKKEIFLKMKSNGEYSLPGGSTERDIPDMQQAINECREEAHINVTGIQSTGISYKKSHESPKWAKKECQIEWQGTFTTVYIAEYKSTYHGKVKKEDQDSFILSGKWYPIKDCLSFFRKEHRDAVVSYIRTEYQKDIIKEFNESSDKPLSYSDKRNILNQAIKDKGYYNKDGVWNSVITFYGDKRIYRDRVETIVIRNKKEIFLKKKPDGSYYLPGGSTEKDLPKKIQAMNECREEARLNVRNIVSSGITYKRLYNNDHYVTDEPIVYDGAVTEIFVAEFDSMYRGYIDEVDRCSFILSGKWYPIKDCLSFFRKEHRDAVVSYIKTMQQESVVEESYTTNYVKNKIQLNKLNKQRDVSVDFIAKCINSCSKTFKTLSKRKDVIKLKRTSKVKDALFPAIEIDLPKNSVMKGNIHVMLSFDDSSFNEASAFKHEDGRYIIALCPSFFRRDKDEQIYIFLHELGHIRLGHTEDKNSKVDIFGNYVYDDYRDKLSVKGKAPYPEVNSDLYAILNGCKMNKILTIVSKDDIVSDGKYEYDLRPTNAELSARYNKVYKKYSKMKRLYESTDNMYSIHTNVINNLVYDNDHTYFLTESNKDELYTILYEYSIINNISNMDKYLKSLKSINSLLSENYEILVEECNFNSRPNRYIEVENKLLSYFTEDVDTPINGGVNDKINIIEKYIDEYVNLVNIITESYNENYKDFDYNNMEEIEIESIKFENSIVDMIDDMIVKLENKNDNDNARYFIYLIESLSKSERDKIPLEKFGIPDTRSYPLDTKAHTKSAIVLFGHSKKKYRTELAKRIIKAMEEFNIPKETVGKNSQLYPYLFS